jgi:hypothetical protein
MLSVILYGRNDSHGYNLHRRAALSLNCIAESLTEPGDEIVFVDYNTPDELPTFPEAIDDCLTARARELLRIVRVRPRWHLPLSRRTRLMALEPQSRNIAIRRCDPANRWILSTNTDMVFIPNAPAKSLSDAISKLEDGFYHLPRLELPEGFWERLDRLNPSAALDEIGAASRRFHLDEVVYGSYDNLYEAPGDFQLFLREDLSRINGFDERMILGWHVDANIARRMRLLRGEVKSAAQFLRGYHCGHSRQPTSLHTEDRTQNDMGLFIEQVVDPACPDQEASWGAPEQVFEERRLDGSIRSRYRLALEAATACPQTADYEVHYNGETFGSPVLNGTHALTHLCDLLFNMEDGQNIYLVASDPDIVGGLQRFLAISAPNSRLLLSESEEAPPKRFFDGAETNIVWLSTDRALVEADLFIVQYPCADQAETDQIRDLRWLAQSIFYRVTEMELAAPPADRRRVITVNAVHSPMEKVVVTSITHAAAPFTTRLRQGFVRDRFDRRKDIDPRQAVFDMTQRLRAYTPAERRLLDEVQRSLVQGRPPLAGWQRLAPELLALASHPEGAARILGNTLADAAELKRKAAEAIDAAVRRASGGAQAVTGRPDTVTRLISGQDWEDADWLAFAARFFAQESLYDLTHRSRWIWERVSVTMAMQKLLDTRQRPWVLLLSPQPDVMALLLANSGFKVAYASVSDFLSDRPATVRDWVTPAISAGIRVITPSDLRPLDEVAAQVEASGGFAGLAAPIGAIFEGGGVQTDRLLAKASALMRPGAVLSCGALVHLNQSVDGGAISHLEWRNLFDPMGPLGSRGFTAIEPPDDRSPLDTAIRFAFEDKAQDTIGGLSFGFGTGFVAPAILSARWPSSLTPGAPRETAILALAPPPPVVVEPAAAPPTASKPEPEPPRTRRPTRPPAKSDRSAAKTQTGAAAKAASAGGAVAAKNGAKRAAAPPRPADPTDKRAARVPDITAAAERDAGPVFDDSPMFDAGQKGMRNLQPFLTAPGARIERTPVGSEVVGAAPLTLAVNIDLGPSHLARFKIRLDAKPSKVTWVPAVGGPVHIQLTEETGGAVIEIAGDNPLGKGRLLISLKVERAKISQFIYL